MSCNFALNNIACNGHIRKKYGYQGQEHERHFALHLNEFEARHYDPQTGRWMVPDPANQFASPYVGMGNAWVNSVDPDGRIAFVAVLAIGMAVGAYTGAAIQSDHGNPMKWDKDWHKGALTGAMIGATIATAWAGSGLLGGKMANSLATFKSLKTAKIMGNTMSGLVNMVNHHDTEQGWGLHSLARFGVGYLGAAVGTAEGGDKIGGMFIGGVLNAATSAASDDDINAYGLAQAFVGGALAAKIGQSFYSSSAYAWGHIDGPEYLINSGVDKMLSYGTQNLAANFAFDEKQQFFKKHWTTHLSAFTVGATGGLLQSEVMNNNFLINSKNQTLKFFTRLTLSSGFYAGEYALNYLGKSGGTKVSWDDFNRFKSTANFMKSFFYSFGAY
jgi:RHS repeat-associated protein